MFHKKTQFFSTVLVLISLTFLSPLSHAAARPTPQTDLPLAWEEGQPLSSTVPQGDPAGISAATAPGTFYRTFSGTRFQPTGSTMTFAPIGGAIYVTTIPAGGYSLSLDFDLPQGATITEVVFFVIDNDATNMSLGLRSYNPETNAFTTLESAASSGASATLQTIVVTVDPPVVVDNTTTSYRLRVAPGVATSAHLLRGARIGYTVPLTFMPLVTR